MIKITIVATFDTPTSKGRKTGERFARETNRERAPADMNYREWKAVYIDKSKPFDAWRAEKDAQYKADSLTSTASRGNFDKTFDLQRFGTYEEQVASHGGSGNIKPDRVIGGHERTPSKTEPLIIIDHKDYKGTIDKRIYYNDTGQPYFEINTTNHGNAKNHPYGKKGEHAHDINWADGKAQRSTRELTTQEREDNGDIL